MWEIGNSQIYEVFLAYSTANGQKNMCPQSSPPHCPTLYRQTRRNMTTLASMAASRSEVQPTNQPTSHCSLFSVLCPPNHCYLFFSFPDDACLRVQYELTLVATDTVNEADATVVIHIADVNDRPPEFDRPNYEATIEEERSDGLPIPLLKVDG